MAEPKFTEGPWRKITETVGDGRVIRREVYGPEGCGRGGKPIAIIPHGFSENAENQDLIWAAPDLYAACEAFVDYYQQAGIGPCPEGRDLRNFDGFDADERRNVRMARAALAKARGEVADAG